MPSEAWQIKPQLVGGALPIKVEIEPQNLKLVVNPVSTEMTSAALGAIGSVGDLRCCKRDSYLAVLVTVKFVKGTSTSKWKLWISDAAVTTATSRTMGTSVPSGRPARSERNGRTLGSRQGSTRARWVRAWQLGHLDIPVAIGSELGAGVGPRALPPKMGRRALGTSERSPHT